MKSRTSTRNLLLLLSGALLLLAGCMRNPDGGSVGQPSNESRPPAGNLVPLPAVPPPSQICVDTIVARDGKFIPERLVVPKNCAVMFTNRDDTVIQIQGHDFILGEMGKDESWAHTYKEPGTFPFFNAKSDTMRGTVVVQP